MAVLGFGIWILIPVGPDTTKGLFSVIDDHFDYKKLWAVLEGYITPVGGGLIGLGILTVMVCCFGLCGACQMNRVCLTLYCIFLTIFVIAFGAVGIIYATNRDKVSLF